MKTTGSVAVLLSLCTLGLVWRGTHSAASEHTHHAYRPPDG